MLKAVEDISPTKKRLRIEIPSQAIEKEIGIALNGIRGRVKMPGFREGKAPIPLIEKRFGKDVEADVLQKVVADSYKDALKEAGITPVTMPVFEESIDFKRHNPLSMTLTIEIRPQVANLKYKGIEVHDIPVTVADEDVGITLKRLQEDKAVYEPSGDEIKTGDIVVIDLKTDEGLEFKDNLFKVGTDAFPSQIGEGLIKKKKDEEFSIEAGFPTAFHIKELADKNLNLKISIREVKKPILPSLDDGLAKDIGFDNIEALKTYIRDELLRAKNDTVSKVKKAEIMKKIVEETECDVPETLIEDEASRLLQSSRLANESLDEESLKKEIRATAIRNAKASLLLDIIGEKEGVSVGEEELKKEIAGLSARLRLSPDNVVKYFMTRDGSLDGLRHSIFEEKVLSLLLKEAVVVAGEAGNDPKKQGD